MESLGHRIIRPRISPRWLLYAMVAAMALANTTWRVLLNNFAVERAAFHGNHMGVLQSVREVPGLLSIGIIPLLFFVTEQRLALAALLLLGGGVALTGFFPSFFGLCATTLLMSFGFHYYQAIEQSLTMQWTDHVDVGTVVGRMTSVDAITSFLVYGLVGAMLWWQMLDYSTLYLCGGLATMLVACVVWGFFPTFSTPHRQHQRFVVRRQYWLYYVLTLLSGARRQIFVAFAGFLLVEKFGVSATTTACLFLVNQALTMWIAPSVGRFVVQVGERAALLVENCGLVLIFIGYALVQSRMGAGGLYILDQIFFSLAIALKIYFKRISAPEDIAATSGVSFTINHIAAIIIPVTFGLLWLQHPRLVFWFGALLAAISAGLALLIPKNTKRI